uniref:Outer membrane protein SusF domain-containing protein n=1 Tax=Segatella copri TaxID=165179 RepID=UPI0025F1E3A0
MKKTLLYSLAVLASVSLASCNGDYDDWANPQTNPQEASAAKYGITFTAGPEAECNMPDEDGVINLVTVNSTDADVTGYTLKDLKVNGEAIKGEINGNSIQVDATELEKILCSQNKSRASVARDINVESKVSVNLASGDAVAINTVGTTTAKLKPSPTPDIDANGYYMLGEVNGNNWDPKNPVWMNKVSDGVYQLKVTTKKDKNYFKFYEGSKFESGNWDVINTGVMGCEKDGSEDASGTIYYTGDSWGTPQTMVIAGTGTWIVTLDMNNLSYSVGKPILYMAGDANGWKQIDVLNSEDGVNFTGYMYLNQNGFKFSTQPNWDGTNYGADFDTAPNAGNIVITEPAGFYQVDVNLSAKSYTLTPFTIGIIGNATPKGWDGDTNMTYNPEERCWELKDVTLTDGEMKFRHTNDWNLSWGGELDNLTTQNGPNIAVAAGTYDIKLEVNWAEGTAKCVMTKK